jgi:dihydroorotase
VVRAAIANPQTIVMSDGARGHPRSAGTFARLIGHYARDQGLMSLMEALRKVTLMPAQRLERRVPAMARKGRIKVGADADITVFDPRGILDRATYTEPLKPSQGIKYVLVNGVVVVTGGRVTSGIAPGTAVRAAIQ